MEINIEEIIKGVRAENTDAMQQLYAEYDIPIMQLCHKMVKNYRQKLGDEITPLDLSEETWARIFRDIGNYDPKMGPFIGWAYGVAQNVFFESLRKSVKMAESHIYISAQRPDEDEDGVDEAIPIDDSVLDRMVAEEERQIVRDAIHALPDKYRDAIIWFYENGFTIREIARFLDISPNTVKVRLCRARKMMQKYIEERQSEEG